MKRIHLYTLIAVSIFILPSCFGQRGVNETIDNSDSQIHSHVSGNSIEENRIEATCTVNGSYDLVTYCVDDGTELSREHKIIPALGHDLQHHDGKSATCTEDGWAAYDTCSRCDYSTKVVIPATAHQHRTTQEENRIESTCLNTGSYDLVTYCLDDGAELSREHKVINALGHDLQHHDGKSATCTEDGWMPYDTCSRCDYSTFVVVPATSHQHSATREENRIEPSCSTNGSYDLVTYCLDDGVELSREHKVINALGHDLQHHDGKSATCTEDGWMPYDTCSRCEYSTKIIIPATDHQNMATREENRIEPTCLDNGSYNLVTYCVDDGVELSRETKTIDALGHNLLHHDGKPAICTEDGWTSYDTCSRCDYSTKVIIPATNHQNTATREENRIEATCLEDGSYELVTYCVDDGVELSREPITIEALGHDLIHHNAQGASCNAEGWEDYDTCSRCDYSTKVAIPTLNHQFGEVIVTTEPTSTENGKGYRICSVCGYREDNVSIDSISLQYLKFEKSGNNYKVVGYNSLDYDHEIVIPSTYNGSPVTSIGYNAFKNDRKLKALTIPNSVTTIESAILQGCNKISSLTTGKGLKLGAFFGSTSFSGAVQTDQYSMMTYRDYDLFGAGGMGGGELRSYYIPSSLKTVTVTKADAVVSSMFSNCSNLETVNLPSDLTKIPAFCFHGTKLNDYSIPESVTTINERAYCNASNSTLDLVIPKNVETISDFAFYGTNFNSITLDDALTTIGEGAFMHCNFDTFTIPVNVKNVQRAALAFKVNKLIWKAANCNDYNRFIPDEYPEAWEYNNFMIEGNCVGEIEFANTVQRIPAYFCGKGNNQVQSWEKALTKIIIAYSVTSIGVEAFMQGYHVSNVIFTGTRSQWNSISKGSPWCSYLDCTYVTCSNGNVNI